VKRFAAVLFVLGLSCAALAQYDAVTTHQRTQVRLPDGTYATRTVEYYADGGINPGASVTVSAGTITVDGGTVNAVQAGTWTVGLNTAVPAGTNNIGDIDVLTTAVTSVTSSTTVQATVTTSSGTVLASNTSRKFAELCNDGTATIYIKLGATATSSHKILVPGRCFVVAPVGQHIYTGVIDAISSSGSQTVSVVEW
jgi:hypothetical protein